jgi:hypothetical protein
MGRPVIHWEFWSEDPERIGAFYEKVFGWTVKPIPQMDYRLVETGGEGGINGGILKPEQEPCPSKTTFYVSVDDLDAYAKKVREAGGKMLVERMKVPGAGEFSLFEDPDGRIVGMWRDIQE